MAQGNMSNDVLNSDEIEKIINELGQLKHSGKYLREALKAGETSQEQVAVYREIRVDSSGDGFRGPRFRNNFAERLPTWLKFWN